MTQMAIFLRTIVCYSIFLIPPYRGKKKLLSEPLFPSVDGWHRRAMGIGDGRASDLGPDLIVDDVPSWLAMMDRTGLKKPYCIRR